MILKLSGREQALALKFKNLPPDLRTKLAAHLGADNMLVLDLSKQELNTLAGLAVRARHSTGNAKTNRAIMRLMKKVIKAAGIDPDHLTPEPPTAASPVARPTPAPPPFNAEAIVETARQALPHWGNMEIKEQIQFISQGFDLSDRRQVEEIVNILVNDANLGPVDEFGGLSPAQVHLLTNCTWDHATPGLQISSQLPADDLTDVLALNYALRFMTALGDRGTRATAKGNLNRKFVRKMVQEMGMPDSYSAYLDEYYKVLNEEDVQPLNMMRILLEQGKLITIKKGQFVVTRMGRDLMDPAKRGDLFRHLIVFKFRVFNLGYSDRLPEFQIFQDFIAYSFYRLSTYPVGQMIDLNEAPKLMLPTVEKEIPRSDLIDFRKSLVEIRLLNPLEEFGLVKLRCETIEGLPNRYTRVTGFQLTDLFHRTVMFDFPE